MSIASAHLEIVRPGRAVATAVAAVVVKAAAAVANAVATTPTDVPRATTGSTNSHVICRGAFQAALAHNLLDPVTATRPVFIQHLCNTRSRSSQSGCC